MSGVKVELDGVIIALVDNNPALLRLPGSDDLVADILPAGRYDPDNHATLEAGIAHWVKLKTNLQPEQFQQLFTSSAPEKCISISFMAFLNDNDLAPSHDLLMKPGWKNVYAFLPWEDWRNGRPQILDKVLLPALEHWADNEGAYATADQFRDAKTRIKNAFGEKSWNDVLVLERFDLLIEAGLLEESVRSGIVRKRRTHEELGVAMAQNHRRMVAAALARVREKLRYQPTAFELLGKTFTLTELQKAVEGLSGQNLHKQNYRRVLEQAKLVEATGQSARQTGGRPAALFRARV